VFSKPYMIYSGTAALLSVIGAGAWMVQHGISGLGGGDRPALVQRISDLERELEGARQSRQDLLQQLSQAQAEAQAARQEQEQLRQEYDALQASSGALDAERQQISQDLAMLQTEKGQLEATVKQFQDDRYLGQLIREKAEMEIQLDRLKLVDQLEKDKAMLETEADRQRAVTDKLASELAVARQEQVSVQEQLETVTREYDTLRLRLAALEADHAVARQDRDTLGGQLGKAREELGEKSTMLEATRRQLEQEQRQTKELQRQKEALTVRLAQTYPAASASSGGVSALTESVVSVPAFSSSGATSGTSSSEGASSVQLAPIVVGGGGSSSAGAVALPSSDGWGREVEPASPTRVTQRSTPSAAGKILTVNGQHNFVVIDIGQEQGVAIGREFGVVRNGESVGLIRVIEVRKRISAADILSGVGRIAADDAIVSR